MIFVGVLKICELSRPRGIPSNKSRRRTLDTIQSIEQRKNTKKMHRRQNRRKMFKGETHKLWTYIHNSRYLFFRRVLFEVLVNAGARFFFKTGIFFGALSKGIRFLNPTHINGPESLRPDKIRNIYF